jgi:hypothetical protein
MRQKRRNGSVTTEASAENEIVHLRGLDLKGLRARWRSVLQRPAPDHLPRHLLFAIIAYRIQVDRFGDLDHETRQLLDRTGAKESGTAMLARLVSFDQKRTELTPLRIHRSFGHYLWRRLSAYLLLADQLEQAEALRKQRELDEKARELEVTIEKRVQASQAELVAKARQDVTDELKSQVSQKDAQIDSLGRTVEELKRKLEQGSQQTQGEAFELELESLLKGKFPLDLIEPVAKGETGGDMVHTVNGQIGASAGVILWELKNTKNWSDAWLPKLRDNKRAAKSLEPCEILTVRIFSESC